MKEKTITTDMVTELSYSEIKLFSVIVRLNRTNREATKSNIDYIIDRRIGSLIGNWKHLAISLLNKGVINIKETKENEDIYFLTELGEHYQKDVVKDLYSSKIFYNEFYPCAEKSQAHKAFCEIAYGKNLCQHGMLNMYQLEKIIELLNVRKEDKILELGCGNGYITEYISDITNGNILGIDLASDAIDSATKRTLPKASRLQFECKNIETIDYETNTFDKIVSIDSLYFLRNLESSLLKLNNILKDNGFIVMSFFFPGNKENLNTLDVVSNSHLGKILEKHNFQYDIFDFTANNLEHWELVKETLDKLKPKFEEESQMFLYNNRKEECRGDYLTKAHRCLFLIKKKS
ncbi:class I SAM-dependent methyltransferase [Oceanirhabdus seepicola]|uniref:Methyltransferase domain-containing protein n=1 Tax=Oceanirhabdus seepicola TaxID=2828781 RepID=A0A9J6P6N7_9CLOT|nr:class I SAM-dependent methyltransferase [Oceanirhabdus seepicola]MCM1991469.1 methyltransferase domain-containing protein [Oceanirhabdus seepicola]